MSDDWTTVYLHHQLPLSWSPKVVRSTKTAEKVDFGNYVAYKQGGRAWRINSSHLSREGKPVSPISTSTHTHTIILAQSVTHMSSASIDSSGLLKCWLRFVGQKGETPCDSVSASGKQPPVCLPWRTCICFFSTWLWEYHEKREPYLFWIFTTCTIQ